MTQPLVVAAFYKFAALPDYRELRDPLFSLCKAQNILGTILLAKEGINGTIAGAPQDIAAILAFLRSDPRLHDLEHKESQAPKDPFLRLRVRLKKEIVTLKAPEADPTKQVGQYVSPQEWNALISDPSVVVIDTRNDYEVEVGRFKGAVDPETKSFGEFPDFAQKHLDPAIHPKVAMYCTGGIRCEKASALLLERGFKEVYHLKGGILKYLEEIAPEQSLWEGDCFVFDNRAGLDHTSFSPKASSDATT